MNNASIVLQAFIDNTLFIEKESDDILEEAIQNIYLGKNLAMIVGELSNHATALNCRNLKKATQLLFAFVTVNDLSNIELNLRNNKLHNLT